VTTHAELAVQRRQTASEPLSVASSGLRIRKFDRFRINSLVSLSHLNVIQWHSLDHRLSYWHSTITAKTQQLLRSAVPAFGPWVCVATQQPLERVMRPDPRRSGPRANHRARYGTSVPLRHFRQAPSAKKNDRLHSTGLVLLLRPGTPHPFGERSARNLWKVSKAQPGWS
jgi:hypothetical protein